MQKLLLPTAFAALLLTGAIFGFFYAWVCSTMWGLDAADPRVAIAAMQAMNASVRNPVFAPAFFGTPVALLLAAVFAFIGTYRRAAMLFAAAGVLYFLGGLLLTMTINVQMNLELAQVDIPQSIDKAAAIWADYSPRWQQFNILRTVVSGAALFLAGLAFLALPRH